MSTHHPPVICPRGSYCSTSTLTEVKCAKGKYNLNSGKSEESSCEHCFDGFYNPIVGQQTCPFQCGPGRYGNHQGAAAIDKTFCTACPKGTYCAGQGTVVPTACPAGRWSSTISIDSVRFCTACPPDTYSSSTGLDADDKCTSCDSGRFSIAGSTTVQNCIGTAFKCETNGEPMYGYQKQTSIKDGSKSSCEQCPVGKYGNDGLKCLFCPSGFYGSTAGAKECVSCNKEVGCGVVPGSSVKVAVVELPQWVKDVHKDIDSQTQDVDATGSTSTTGTNATGKAPKVSEFQLGDGAKPVSETFNYLLQVSMYPPLLVACLFLLIFHRHFPMRCCVWDEFANHHLVQDTHAIRKVRSRLGGAFTWMLLCLMIVLVTNSILDRGSTISSTDTAERSTSFDDLSLKALGSGASGFGTLHVEIEAFAMLSQAELDKKCQQITLLPEPHHSNLFTCSITKTMASTCNVTLNCETTFNLRGEFSLSFQLPTEFQTLAWSVNAKTWEFFEQARGSDQWLRYQTTVNHTTVAPKGHLLSGSTENPSRAMFGLTRGFTDGSHVARNKSSSGLQLSYTQTDSVFATIDNFAESTHVVDFEFVVLPALHVEVVTQKLSNTQLLASIFSLLGAATKLLSICKKKIAKKIDGKLSKRDNVPEDVTRRMELLHEDNLLHKRFRKLMDHHGIESSHDLKSSNVILPRMSINYLANGTPKGQSNGFAFTFQSRRRSNISRVPVSDKKAVGIEMTDVAVSNKKEVEDEEVSKMSEKMIASASDIQTREEMLAAVDDVAVDVAGESESEVLSLTLQMRVDDLEKENDELITKLSDALETQQLMLKRLKELETVVKQIEEDE